MAAPLALLLRLLLRLLAAAEAAEGEARHLAGAAEVVETERRQGGLAEAAVVGGRAARAGPLPRVQRGHMPLP